MNEVIYYKAFLENMGDNIILSPLIPKFKIKNEEIRTARISVQPTILQSLKAIDAVRLLKDSNDNELPVYIYGTVIDDKSVIMQPPINKVPDRWTTGELWIRNKQQFVKIYKGYLRKQFDFPNISYSRYTFTIEGSEPIINIITAATIYGEEDNFSFIDLDYNRIKESVEYAEKYPYIR